MGVDQGRPVFFLPILRSHRPLSLRRPALDARLSRTRGGTLLRGGQLLRRLRNHSRCYARRHLQSLPISRQKASPGHVQVRMAVLSVGVVF